MRREGWPLVDGWYWCPPSVVKKRIQDERKRLEDVMHLGGIAFGFQTWKDDQNELSARLAHACEDGRIRAPSGWGIEEFQNIGGIVKIYGKCRFCDEQLSDGIKTIITMERMDHD